MNLPINHNPPEIIHIDLNSCFATVRQQAFPHLRGKPIAIAAYTTPSGCILAPSIEAKKYGIKTAMTVREGKLLCPELQVFEPDPQMVKDVHVKFKNVCKYFSPDVEDDWLNPDMVELEHIKQFLQPYPDEELEAYPISTRVNSPFNNSGDIINPA